MGSLHHLTVLARDPARTARFYSEELGLELVERTQGLDDPATEMLTFSAGEAVGLSFLYYPRCQRAAPGWGSVASVGLGVPRLKPGWARERWGEREVALVRDPDGLTLALTEGHGVWSLHLYCREVAATSEFWSDLEGVEIALTPVDRSAQLGFGAVHHLAVECCSEEEFGSFERLPAVSAPMRRDGYRSLYLYSPDDLLREVVAPAPRNRRRRRKVMR